MCLRQPATYHRPRNTSRQRNRHQPKAAVTRATTRASRQPEGTLTAPAAAAMDRAMSTGPCRWTATTNTTSTVTVMVLAARVDLADEHSHLMWTREFAASPG